MTDGPGILTLEVDYQIIQAGVDQSKLTVKLDGKLVTEDVVFIDGKNNVVDLGPDFVFTTTEAGEYSFWATYKKYNSNTVTITVVNTPVPQTPEDPQPESTSFVRRVLLTKVTGAGCIACPNMTLALHDFFANNELAKHTVKAEAHTYDGGYDPAQLSSFYSVSSWPTLIFDWAFSFTPSQNVVTLHAVEEYVKQRYEAEQAKAAIAVNSICENGAITFKVCVKAAESTQYRVGAWLLEDNIQGQQSGVDSRPENAFYHEFDDCIRIADSKLSSSVWSGHKLGGIEAGKTAEKMFSWTLKESWKVENLKLCIFVSTPDEAGRNYYVNNVIVAPINGMTQFEYAK